MATRKFKCKVCGYVHEGDKAPDRCPMCQAPSSEFEEITESGAEEVPQTGKKGLNTNGNMYTIIYSAIIVVIVAFLMAFVFQALKPAQDANVALDKKKQILAALNIRNLVQ
jgi:Na+-transporting NADH:ubiquinone oxidoreductase subunit C